MPSPIEDRLAVCSWSLQPESPAVLIEKLNAIGIYKVQLSLDPLREGGPWSHAKEELAAADISYVGGMMMAEGEDYATLESIKETGGVVPDATWPTTWDNIQKMADIAADLGIDYVMFHAGFLPHEPSDPSFEKLTGRVAQVADLMADRKITLGMETGQEDAATLLQFLQLLNKPNVKVNFDPANMILYAKGDPIDSLRMLMPHVFQCHIKDANLTQQPGIWGTEEVTGTGEVDWPAFFGVLEQAGFEGYLAIEREWGDQRVADIKAGKEHILQVASAAI